jgi:hypothetical protein
MTNFEVLTLLIACIAVLVSLYTLREQRKLQREANELQKSAAELAKRQIAQLEQADADRLKTELEVVIDRNGNGHTLRIGNTGMADAFEVNIDFSLPDGVTSPLTDETRADRLPAQRLRPSSWLLFPCAIYLESPPFFEGTVSWKNPDGSKSSGQFKLFVP